MYVQVNNGNWVAEVEESGRYKYRLCTINKIFNKNDFYGYSSLAPATEQQIAHLEACIAADKYLPYTDEMLTLNYSIY